MDNKKPAILFSEMAEMLEIKGADFFRVNAYRKAGRFFENLGHDFDEKNSEHLAGIGKSLREKIDEIALTGTFKEYEKLKEEFPEGLLEILKIRGVGPKKVRFFWHNLGITTVATLKKACLAGQIREIDGFGVKSEKEILAGIEEYEKFDLKRLNLAEAYNLAEELVVHMKKCPAVKKIAYAGSLRRFKETVGDIDALVSVENPQQESKIVMNYFFEFSRLLKKINEGKTKATIFASPGVDVDLRVVEEKSFGSALHYFTGSKEHNVRIRDLAKKQGLKVNEYGIFKGDEYLAGKNEEEFFKVLNLAWIPPELRRDEGEFEKKIPFLVEIKDLKGDLHNHSNYSDGVNSLEEMLLAHLQKGYSYFAFTDHSKLMPIAQGLTEEKIKRQWAEIDNLQKKYPQIKILKGCETDILKNGDLDFREEILKKLDIVIISAHLYQKLDKETQTKRLLRAIENPYSMILAHPLGRIINKRESLNFDFEKIVKACILNKVALEINASPARLDLPYQQIMIAKDLGAKFVISSDAHDSQMPNNIFFGVAEARKAWLEKNDILNTKDLNEFDSYFRRGILEK